MALRFQPAAMQFGMCEKSFHAPRKQLHAIVWALCAGPGMLVETVAVEQTGLLGLRTDGARRMASDSHRIGATGPSKMNS